ncbi:MAG TPA: dihydrofolate reductase family protein [Candidatus Dormibacteraeota bacterium]|nr:dihydrofolate reductase family protein [Candidatus Dormibacteraeota bacterium]
MRIKARMGMSIDGYVAKVDGTPSLVASAAFLPGESHGYPEFIEGCDAVAMGRETFLPALGAPEWPWREMAVFVLTSRPLSAGAPASVATSAGPRELVEKLRSRGSDGDVHLVGGPRTIRAIYELGALDSLEVVVLPMLLGEGIPIWPRGVPLPSLRLSREPRIFPDGSVELAYALEVA